MKIVIDANRLIAALIAQSTTRELLLNDNFVFIAPDTIVAEIRKHRKELVKKAKISGQEFDVLFELFFERITVVPKVDYEKF